MFWLFGFNVLFYTGAFVAFIMGYGWIALVCLIAALVLTLIMNEIDKEPESKPKQRGGYAGGTASDSSPATYVPYSASSDSGHCSSDSSSSSSCD